MALETLKGVSKIGGYKVWQKMKTAYVTIDDRTNTIAFRIQDGPIKEHGVNGCQVDTLVHAAVKIISELNKKFPSHDNDSCLVHLKIAIDHLERRKADREKRGVEGYNKE